MADLVALAPVQMVDMWQVGTAMVGVPGPRGATGATGPQGDTGPAGADSTVPGPQGPPGRQPASLVADPAHPGLYLMAVGTDLTPDPAHAGLYLIGASA